jgi:hypothetical protein
MRLDLLRELPIPELLPLQRRAIERHVSDALVARTAGEAAETEAIRIIEEEVLPAWLD